MSRARVGCAIAAMIAGCAPSERIALILEDTESLLIALRRGSVIELKARDVIAGVAIDLELGKLDEDENAEVAVAQYHRRLVELGLDEHPVLSNSGRSIPEPDQTLHGTLTSEFAGWNEINFEDSWLKELRISSATFAECISAGGCVDSSSGTLVCRSPCPAQPQPQEPEPPLLPSSPARPQWDCPPGWQSIAAGGFDACDPFPDPEVSCPIDQGRFPGRADCAPIGTACAGEWPKGQGIFVRPGAIGGTGTRDAPLGTIAEALQAAGSNTPILLAAGTFREDLSLDAGGHTLIGACAGGTTLSGTVAVDGATIALQDLSIHGRLFADGASTFVRLEGVVIHGGQRSLRVTGGAIVRFFELGLRDTPGIALRVDNATVTGDRLFVAGARRVGVAAVSGSHLALSDAAVLDTAPDGGLFGVGISIESGSRAILVRTAVLRSSNAGIGVFSAAVEARDLFLETVRQDADCCGFGVAISRGSTMSISRALIADTERYGLGAVDSSLFAADVVVTETRQNPHGALGGIFASSSALELERTAVTDAQGDGVLLSKSEAALTDVFIENVVLETGATNGGVGLDLEESNATVERLQMRDTVRGILAFNSELDLTDVSVRDIATHPNAEYSGAGVIYLQSSGALARVETTQVGLGAFRFEVSTIEATDLSANQCGADGLLTGPPGTASSLRATRVKIEDAGRQAMGLFGTGMFELRDVTIAGAGAGDCLSCAGLCLDKVDATMERVRIDRAAGTGLGVIGSIVTGSDVWIAGTEPAGPCRGPPPVGLPRGRGYGLAALDGASVSLRSFQVEGSAEYGVVAVRAIRGVDVSLQLSEGTVRDQPVGIVVAPDFDFSKVSDRVVWDNERNVASDPGLFAP